MITIKLQRAGDVADTIRKRGMSLKRAIIYLVTLSSMTRDAKSVELVELEVMKSGKNIASDFKSLSDLKSFVIESDLEYMYLSISDCFFKNSKLTIHI